MQKLSISLPPSLAEQVRETVRDEGTTLSAFMVEAAEDALRRRGMRAALKEWEADGVTLDAGALTAADRGDQVFLMRWSRVVAQGRLPSVSASVVAQVWRRADHPRISRVLALCRVDRLDLSTAKEVGRLLAASGTNDVIDAEVVLGAIRRGDEIWGSDPDDVRRIANATGTPVQVLAF